MFYDILSISVEWSFHPFLKTIIPMLSMHTVCQLTMLTEERDLFITKCCNFSALMKMDAYNHGYLFTQK